MSFIRNYFKELIIEAEEDSKRKRELFEQKELNSQLEILAKCKSSHTDVITCNCSNLRDYLRDKGYNVDRYCKG